MAETEKPFDKDMHRRQRGKNIAVALLLVAFVVVVYLVAIVRMSGDAG